MKSIVLSALLVCTHHWAFGSNLSGHESNWVRIDPRGLVMYSADEDAPKILVSDVGKRVVKQLLNSNEQAASTTSCRLENKRVVSKEDLAIILAQLEMQGYNLQNREVKNLPKGSRAGTFTFYGKSIKFQESSHLPKTSIKMRIRAYLVDDGHKVQRSVGTENSAFLEIKIKNPYPEYPLSVHKYRLMMPDEDILELVTSNPRKQHTFFKLIRKLANRAHDRDTEGVNARLIDALFDEIRILAIADPAFIRPTVGITYFRTSKKYDEAIANSSSKKIKLRRKKNEGEAKIRSYEMTIDESVKAFAVDLSEDNKTINIEKYFTDKDSDSYLICQYPIDARIVEFKQPDAIGYDGPGRFRNPQKMSIPQRHLWQAFVSDLGEKALIGTKRDGGKFYHVKQFMRIRDNNGRDGEKTILYKN